MQRSRQRWLRGVIVFLTKIRVSKECIKLLLCDQVCKDGLRGRVITSYPQVMPYDNEDDKEYIGACLTGETHSCFKASNLFRNYNERSCETDCTTDFPQCGIDMRRRLMSRVAVNVARPIHVLGMNLLKLEWIARDSFKSRGRFPILRRRDLNTLENLVDMKLMLRKIRISGFRYSLKSQSGEMYTAYHHPTICYLIHYFVQLKILWLCYEKLLLLETGWSNYHISRKKKIETWVLWRLWLLCTFKRFINRLFQNHKTGTHEHFDTKIFRFRMNNCFGNSSNKIPRIIFQSSSASANEQREDWNLNASGSDQKNHIDCIELNWVKIPKTYPLFTYNIHYGKSSSIPEPIDFIKWGNIL